MPFSLFCDEFYGVDMCHLTPDTMDGSLVNLEHFLPITWIGISGELRSGAPPLDQYIQWLQILGDNIFLTSGVLFDVVAINNLFNAL